MIDLPISKQSQSIADAFLTGKEFIIFPIQSIRREMRLDKDLTDKGKNDLVKRDLDSSREFGEKIREQR